MKPYWNIDRVYQMTSLNIAKYLTFLHGQDGKPYAGMSPAAKIYFKKNSGSDYFGQIVTSFNFLGFITRDSFGIFHLNSLAKRLVVNKELIPYFLEYSLVKLQFPRPNLADGRSLPISKPFIDVLKLLLLIYKSAGAHEAYLTEGEFSFVFGPQQTKIDSNLVSSILSHGRALGLSSSSDSLSNELSYNKAYFLCSRVLTTDETLFPGLKQKFYIGLRSDFVDLAEFLVAHYGKEKFEFNRTVPKSDVTLLNEWSNYISNEADFFNFLKLVNMIEHIKPFKDYTLNKGFHFDEELIRRFITSMISKRYLILTGISGSGKSKIAELFGNYLKETSKGDFCLESVGSNWNDNKKLLGYVNPLITSGPGYLSTKVVDFIKNANADATKNFILLLDEMNLSYTERYFSDFLSALESFDGKIVLADGNSIYWSDNLKIIGTINEDETTHTLSPKVIDRANIIEMNGRLPSEYFSTLLGHGSKEVIKWSQSIWFDEYKKLLDEIFTATNGGFGLRIVNEVTGYICLNTSVLPDSNFKVFLDEQLYQKILPKIHGARSNVKSKIDALYDLLSKENNLFSKTLEKLEKMRVQLQQTGFTSFITA